MFNEYTALSPIFPSSSYYYFLTSRTHPVVAGPLLWFLKLFSVQFNNSLSDDLHRVGFDCCSFLFHDPHSITLNFPSLSTHSLTNILLSCYRKSLDFFPSLSFFVLLLLHACAITSECVYM